MKKIPFLLLVLFLIGCSSKLKTTGTKPLYEILSTQSDGGASIRFFEILTEEKEIKMLQNDDDLKTKITADDLNTSNFVILNMGEKATPDYTIAVEKVEETPDKIIITTRDQNPKESLTADQDVYYYPYTIVKINSKKTIEVR